MMVEEDTARGYHPARYHHNDPDTHGQGSGADEGEVIDHSSRDSTDRSEIKTSVL